MVVQSCFGGYWILWNGHSEFIQLYVSVQEHIPLFFRATKPATLALLPGNIYKQMLTLKLAASTWSFTPINHGISKIHIHLCHVKQKYPQESSCWFVMWQEQTTASWSWSYLLYSKMWSPYPLKQGLKQILKNLIVDCFRSGLVEPRFWWGPHGRWWGLIHWWTPDLIGDQHVLGGQQGARVWGHLAF